MMISPAEAMQVVLDAACLLPPRRVPLMAAAGRFLAESVRPDRSYPPFRRAMMDGFAVCVASAARTIRIIGEQAAGQDRGLQVNDEQCVEVMTGAACPPGTEAVVEKEHVRRSGDHVLLPAEIALGQHIAEVGSECAADEVTLTPGTRITPLAVAMLATFGVGDVLVTPPPRVAVITTGEELSVGPRSPAAGQIRDSNGPMLLALALDIGLELPSYRLVGDDRSAIREALDEAFDCDLVIVSGGVSAGTYDLVPEVLSGCRAEILLHKVAQKPGKPLLFARRRQQLIFGLPGNPLACHFCFTRYVTAAVRRMENKPATPTVFQGQLLARVRAKLGRTHFIPALAEPLAESHCGWQLTPLPGVSSADIFHSHRANAYIEMPRDAADVPAGQSLPFTLIG